MIERLLVGGRVVRCDPSLEAREEAIGIEAGRIAFVGPREAAPEAADLIELDGALVLPGFVDPHTHLVFAGSRADEFARRMAGVDYATIAAEGGGIASTVRATREASEDTLYTLAESRALAMRALGVTSLEIKSGYGLSTEHELRLLRVARRLGEEGVVRVTTSFLGAHALPPDRKNDRQGYVDEVVNQQLPAVVAEKLADTVDVYCDEGAFTLEETRRILEAARSHGLQVRAHVGQFADLGGAELAAALGALSADHLEEVGDSALDALAAAGTVAVLLPGAWRTLRQSPPRAERFRGAGVTMAVGTDFNPGTSPTYDLQLCAALAVRDAGMTSEEAILGITRHAAKAAGIADVGWIRQGARADLAIFAIDSPHALTYALGGTRASMVLLDGRVVQRENVRSLW